MSTAPRLVNFNFPRSSAQPAEQSSVVNGDLERRIYMEAVSAAKGSDFDDAVLAVYAYEPEPDLPSEKNSRRRQPRYSFPQ